MGQKSLAPTFAPLTDINNFPGNLFPKAAPMFRRITLAVAVAATLVASFPLATPAQARPYRYRSYSYRGSLMARPQYPRSMRSRGLKQLGPVPALGGVRSLPFWGGER